MLLNGYLYHKIKSRDQQGKVRCRQQDIEQYDLGADIKLFESTVFLIHL